MENSIYVIKVGSDSVYQKDSPILSEIKDLLDKNKKVILVSGGARSIKDYYYENSIEEKFVTLYKNGDSVRFSNSEDIYNIKNAYLNGVLKILKTEFSEYKIYCHTGDFNNLISGEVGKPLKINQNGKPQILRGSHYGTIKSISEKNVRNLLAINDLIILSPPVYEESLKSIINVDADMLASHLAVSLKAAHLRFVTSSPGILKNINDSESLIKDIYLDSDLTSVKGRMKQKVRAANFALKNGYCDIQICGYNSLYKSHSTFWRMNSYTKNIDLKKVINIPSVSTDEEVLSIYLLEKYKSVFDKSYIDNAGNIVFEKGNGSNTVLLLGHIDTVPYYWTPKNTENNIFARGSVDAKSNYFNFVQAAINISVPKNCKLLVIGATEEEVSSSKGAFFVRDNYAANHVIIGEPSGYNALTLGYFGLTKLKLTISKKREHSAAKDSVGIIEMLLDYIEQLKAFIMDLDSQSLSTILDIKKYKDNEKDFATCTINFRTSIKSPENLMEQIFNFNKEFKNTKINILRSTKGYTSKRTNDIVKSFNFAFKTNEISQYKFLNKKGTSDMNTLATTWNVPMVAYGPGDSSLDHTENEQIELSEFDKSNKVLVSSLQNLFSRIGD